MLLCAGNELRMLIDIALHRNQDFDAGDFGFCALSGGLAAGSLTFAVKRKAGTDDPAFNEVFKFYTWILEYPHQCFCIKGTAHFFQKFLHASRNGPRTLLSS